jgi:NADH-quinone oxidoreductase subunit I
VDGRDREENRDPRQGDPGVATGARPAAATHPPLTGDVVTTGQLARRGQPLLPRVYRTVVTTLQALGAVISHAFRERDTVQYPEEMVYLPPRYRGRIVLSRDPDGNERCVACYLCAVACPVDCIALQASQDETGRRYPAWFRINFSRCIFCGFCEDACPTYAIQLTPDVEMCEYERASMVYEKEDLLIAGPGKYPEYDFYRVAGLAVGGKDKGEAEREAPPVDLRDLLP